PSLRLIRCPAVPAKVRLAFWPGVVTVADTGAPPGVIVPVASAGAAQSVTVIVPVADDCGLSENVYVPVWASVFVSTKAPLIPTVSEETSVVASGFATETFQAPPATAPNLKLSRWPAVAPKVRLAFWPGVVTVADTGAPPGVIVPVASAGTS